VKNVVSFERESSIKYGNYQVKLREKTTINLIRGMHANLIKASALNLQ
jgi:hypothetical protein